MQNFVNPSFRQIYNGITRSMPALTFAGIIATYLITAALTTYFIDLPLLLAVAAALAIQFGRFAVVFMDFLNPTGTRSPWPPIIATLATVTALVELYFSIRHLNYQENQTWAVFLFGGMVICFGYILELQFIHKGAEAFGMIKRQSAQGAASEQQTAAPVESYSHAYSPATSHSAPALREEEPAIPFEMSLNGNGRH